MIHALDHLLLITTDVAAASAKLATLLASVPAREGTTAGMPSLAFPLANTTILLATPAPDNPLGLAGAPADSSVAQAAAAFAVADLDAARALLPRRGLPCGNPLPWTAEDGTTTRALVLDRAATDGIALLLVERPPAPTRPGPRPAIGIDHVVIRTHNPDRALALFGARLGLDLRLDRTNYGTRFLFFRCGDLVVEVVQPSGEAASAEPASFNGLAWRSPTLAADHARLSAAGVPVSELRTGRKPGTQLFTVRENAALVPSIFIELGRKGGE